MKQQVIFKLEDGYYHHTAEEDLTGPFDTIELAQASYDAYCKWFQHDHKNSIRKMRDYYD